MNRLLTLSDFLGSLYVQDFGIPDFFRIAAGVCDIALE